MDSRETATAHQMWDGRWATDAGRAAWLAPESEVLSVTAALRLPVRALDLGCGVGRHVLSLAERGFSAFGLDASRSGIEFCRQEAARRGLRLGLAAAAMTDLPYATATFDYVLAWNVICHGDGDVVRRCLAEIHRVLRPGGIYHSTMPTKRHRSFGVGREVAPNTFVDDAATDGDKRHPHFYCDRSELVELFGAFELTSVVELEARSGGHHWHVVAARRG
jgi:SAM-dependent methyltransferase